MSNHLRLAGSDAATQRSALVDIVMGTPCLVDVLHGLRHLGLPDAWLVSGAIYNTVWNVLTGRPSLNGVRDIDVFYWDDADLSYEAEDIVIRRAVPVFAALPLPVQIRNQARVHLWYEDHFGEPYAPLHSSRDGIDRFASITHSVAVRLDDGGLLDVYAPYGLDDLSSFRIVPNRRMNNRATHEAKGARALSVWPELSLIPW